MKRIALLSLVLFACPANKAPPPPAPAPLRPEKAAPPGVDLRHGEGPGINMTNRGGISFGSPIGINPMSGNLTFEVAPGFHLEP